MPNYCIMRVSKLTSFGNISASAKHTFRERETKNANPDLTKNNEPETSFKAQEVVEKIKDRVQGLKVRKNAVLALEYLVTYSPDALHDGGESQQYFDRAKKWLEAKHGKENMVCTVVHRDEKTPHMVAYIVPIDERGKLCASKFVDGRDKLSAMQTDFHDKVGRKFNLDRGIEKSVASHKSVKTYYQELQQVEKSEPLIIPDYKPPTKVDKLKYLVGAESQINKNHSIIDNTINRLIKDRQVLQKGYGDIKASVAPLEKDNKRLKDDLSRITEERNKYARYLQTLQNDIELRQKYFADVDEKREKERVEALERKEAQKARDMARHRGGFER